MGIFSKILNFSKTESEKILEKRDNSRFIVPTGFPLKGHIVSQKNVRRALKILDISSFGIKASFSKKDQEGFLAGEDVNLFLIIDDKEFVYKASVAHMDGKEIGLNLYTPTGEEAYSFVQILTPLQVGQTFLEMNSADVNQNEAGYHKRIFYADLNASLIVWEPLPESENVLKAAFTFGDVSYHVEGNKTRVFSASEGSSEVKKHHKAGILNEVKKSSKMAKEVVKLVEWTFANAKESLPENIRSLFVN